MRNYKKALAGVLAATMVLGSSLASLAADQSTSATGEGKADIPETSDVFVMDVPAQSDGEAAFTYILDPKGVINKTNADKYSNATFEADKTVYFPNTASTQSGNGSASYSSISDALEVTNKSSIPVDVEVTAQLAASTKISIVESDQFTGNAASLYLALKDSAGVTSAIKAETGGKLSHTIPGSPNNFEVKYNSTNGKYEFGEKATLAAPFATYSFQLTGACNSNGVWDGITDADAPDVTVTWTVKDPKGPQVSLAADGTITMSGLTAAKNYAHSAVLSYGDASDELDVDPNMEWDTTNWSTDNGGTLIFKLSPAWLSALSGKSATVTVTLTGGTTITATRQF